VAKALDPVTRYATDVCNGVIVAAKLIRLACARHLRDLEQQAEKGLEWKPAAAQEVIDFFAEVLCLPDEAEEGIAADTGKPFVLSPFQQFIVGSLFGWYTAAGPRRFRIAYVETAKGSGKTPLGAGIMLYMLVADGERGAQVYTAAVTKDQAKLAFTDAENMVQASPHLRELIDHKVNNLAVIETGSFMRPISSEKRGLDGKRVHGCLIDELHEHATPIVTTKMRAGTKNRQNAIIFEITNSGFDRETVCWQHHDYSRQVLEGTIDNDAWFAFVCHLDACPKCAEAGKYQPADDCPDCDDWTTEGPHWLKANPNIGISLSWQYLREQVREAINIPSQRNMVRRLNFCQWTQQDAVFIPVEKWKACETTLLPAALVKRPCYLGIDLSDKIDLSSVVCVFPRELEHAMDGGDVALNVAIDVLPFFWMPRKSIAKRAQEDRVPYDEWERDEHVKSTHGETVDHDAIVDFIIEDLAKKYSIQAIGIDASGAAAVVNRLQRQFGDEKVVEVPQSFRQLSEPTKTLEALVVSSNLAHPGNKCLDWNVSNMAIEENTWREIRPVKIEQRKRIDGGVALIDALKVMQLVPFQPNVYLRRGVRTLGA
jgi:phage terminase large subunit-like protein